MFIFPRFCTYGWGHIQDSLASYPGFEVLPCSDSEGVGDGEGARGDKDDGVGEDASTHYEKVVKDGREACGESRVAARTQP